MATHHRKLASNDRFLLSPPEADPLGLTSVRTIRSGEDNPQNGVVTFCAEVSSRDCGVNCCGRGLSRGAMKPLIIRDTPHRGYRTEIALVRRKRRCPETGAVFTPGSSDINPTLKMTNRAIEQAVCLALRHRFSDVTRMTGVGNAKYRSTTMPASRDGLAGLPDWPRRLSREQAAAYVGLSPTTFDIDVAAGRLPQPLQRGRRKLWDRAAIDHKLDSEIGFARSASFTVHSGEDDPILRAADAYQDHARS